MYMTGFIFYTVIYMMMIGLFSFCSFRKHLLLTLLSLEFLIVILFFVFFLFLSFYSFEYNFLIIFLVFSVCEGVLGLSILVSMIRCHGNDNLMNLSSLSW